MDSKRLCFDAHEIESGVEIDDLNAVVCEVKDVTSKSTLFGAPPGWSPPGPPDDWNPTLKRGREKWVDMSSSTKVGRTTIQQERIADLVQAGRIYSLQIETLHWMQHSSRNWDLRSREW